MQPRLLDYSVTPTVRWKYPVLGKEVVLKAVRYHSFKLSLDAFLPKVQGKTKKYNKNQRSWAKQAFEFVNTSATVNAIDVATRARIRRHAKLHGSSADRSAEKADEDLATCQMVAAAPNLRQVWAVDPFGQFPFKLEPYMYDLLWCSMSTF